jgi:hypothetical protein
VRVKTDIVDGAVLDALSKLLEARATDIAVGRALERAQAQCGAAIDRRDEIEHELSATDARLRRLADAVASADDAPVETLVTRINAEELRKKALAAELELLTARRRSAPIDSSELRRGFASAPQTSARSSAGGRITPADPGGTST